MSDYEEDHLVPLELGGAPRDPGNLWPEPHYGTKTASTKDGTETKLKNAVCNGTISLSAARSAIKNNWTTALQVTWHRLTSSEVATPDRPVIDSKRSAARM
ncbi:hypothetical protein [Streptomyces sp. Root369]|uniref:hypothetical protein n=1 Tax=Streptomyces sp. Root369 TaxID=1736523 RepID=UPI0007C7002E|nr:hypothetical protein [Streptomyces sp. Root369]